MNKTKTIRKNGSAEELMKSVDSAIEKIFGYFESEQYRNYLTTLSRFHDYSLNNTLLIAAQKPDATLVAGYTAWQKNFGRQVNKGEKAIRILAPAPYKKKAEVDKIDPDTGVILMNPDGTHKKEMKEIVVPAFKVVNVFDVSQTDGKELPTIGVDELTGDVEQYQQFREALERSSPVPIGMEDIPTGAKGYFHTVENRIAIQTGMSEVQTVKTLIHEITHARLHSTEPKEKSAEEPKLTRNSKEVEAESVAYTVCQHFGIETSDYSFAYIAGWSKGKDTPELKASLDRIRKAANEMITEIEGHFQDILQERAEQEAAVEATPENAAVEAVPENDAALLASDVTGLRLISSDYFPTMRTEENVLSCRIKGVPAEIRYEVSQHDDGEAFTIHSTGQDIWDTMSRDELINLSYALNEAVQFGTWMKKIEAANTVETVQFLREDFMYDETTHLSRENAQKLHRAFDRKEAKLARETPSQNTGLQENGLYRYYSTQRPVGPGTFPMTDQKPVNVVNFDKRIMVENDTIRAWGYLEMKEPYTRKQLNAYELVAAPDRPPVAEQKKGSVLAELHEKSAATGAPGKAKETRKRQEEIR